MLTNKKLLEDSLNDAIATFKSEAGQTMNYCPEDAVLTMGETHKAMAKALESFKNVIVHYCE